MFLTADTQLYQRLSLSVHWSIRRFLQWSVCQSVSVMIEMGVGCHCPPIRNDFVTRVACLKGKLFVCVSEWGGGLDGVGCPCPPVRKKIGDPRVTCFIQISNGITENMCTTLARVQSLVRLSLHNAYVRIVNNKNIINFERPSLLKQLSYLPQIGLILKSCVRSLK